MYAYALLIIALGSSTDTLVLESPEEMYSAGEYLQVLKTSNTDITLPQVLNSPQYSFVKHKYNQLAMDFSDDVYWLHLTIKNNSKHNDWVLHFNDWALQQIFIYNTKNNLPIKFGLNYPMNQKPIYGRTYAFPLHIDYQKEANLYIKLYAPLTSVKLPITVSTQKKYDRFVLIENWVLGVILGIIFILGIVASFTYLGTKDKAYLSYTLMCLLTLLVYLDSFGILALLVSNQFQYMIHSSFSTTLVLLMMSSYLLFARDYLQIKKHTPRINLIIVGIIIFLGAMAICNPLLFSFKTQTLALIPAALLVNLAQAFIIIVYFSKRVRSVYFYSLGFFFFIVGGNLMFLRVVGMVPNNFITTHSIHIGTVLQFIVLAFGMTDRINMLNGEVKAYSKKLQEMNHNLEQLVALRTQELEEERNNLEIMAREDVLTKLHNRRYTMELLEFEFERFKRYQQPFSLLLFDIDNFKTINDSYGHLAGDDVLKAYADVLKSNLRKTDICGRVGGEEFLIVLCETELENGHVVAEKIRSMTKKMTFTSTGASIKVTVSCGITQVSQQDTHINTIIKRADNALYKAKQAGKDQSQKSIA